MKDKQSRKASCAIVDNREWLVNCVRWDCDCVRRTVLGKCLAMFWILCGICVTSAFTASITTLLSSFQQAMTEMAALDDGRVRPRVFLFFYLFSIRSLFLLLLSLIWQHGNFLALDFLLSLFILIASCRQFAKFNYDTHSHSDETC